MISEYIDSFDEFYKLDLSFSEFYSQHYGDYRHMDCEVGNPFEIFDGNGHKIREKRIERMFCWYKKEGTICPNRGNIGTEKST